MAMPDIDFAQSEAIDAELFQKRRSFPGISVEHFLIGGGCCPILAEGCPLRAGA